MAPHKRPALSKVRHRSCSDGPQSRHTPLSLDNALDMCHAWVEWIERQGKVLTRDEKRIREAFDLLACETDNRPYCSFLRKAKAIGGDELVLLLALAVGKAAFKNMSLKLKRSLPEKAADRRWHLSRYLRDFVCQFAPGDVNVSSDIATGGTATSAPVLHDKSEPTSSQHAALSLASQSQHQTDLAGSVYELTPADLLEVTTGLITERLSCPGQVLMTEPFLPWAKPFITIPINTKLCLYFREQRQKVM